MRLNAMDVAVGEVLSVEIDFQAFDRALDAGTLGIPDTVPDGMLGMVPVDLRKVSTVDSDVPALAVSQAASR